MKGGERERTSNKHLFQRILKLEQAVLEPELFIYREKHSFPPPRRRIQTEEKANVVAAVWGMELIKFLAALQLFSTG